MNSLIEPTVQELLEKVDNRFMLVTIAARRARQLIGGQGPLIESDTLKPLTIATNEIDEGLIEYEVLKNGVK